MVNKMSTLQLRWNAGTAYDLFVSLYVLHEPTRFGLRPAWAAGVRSRLSPADRQILEQAAAAIFLPFHWVRNLSEPQDTSTVLWGLRSITPAEILPTLGLRPDLPEGAAAVFQDVASRGKWDAADLAALRSAYQSSYAKPSIKRLEERLSVWATAESFGSRFPAALRAYWDVFFAEEEGRISSVLQSSLSDARNMAAQMPVSELIEQLSHGIRLERTLDLQELVLVPSYWIAPLVVFESLGPGCELFLFGARPPEVSLVPGELLPDGMLRILKTLGDPTRLRILRYLSQESITPAELSRRLRLRPPTVTHHLNQLRLAGLVFLTIEEDGGKRYQSRPEAVDEAYQVLKSFICPSCEDPPC